ncbi:MAG: hypothetical protein IT364_18790 [Candidatus Hydrogenedentes bacterium]|nr:hypothetical protein [Candidatus Hydrogenedentota bacterium]
MMRWSLIAACTLGAFLPASAGEVSIDPMTRCARITYAVPADAPDVVDVTCAWAPAGSTEWRPAAITPNVSETALRLAPSAVSGAWRQGKLQERRAAGLNRSVVFNPYPDAQQNGLVDVSFRVAVQGPGGAVLAEEVVPIQCDNSDVVYIEDWSAVTTSDAVSTGDNTDTKLWKWKMDLDSSADVTLGNALYGDAGPGQALRPLSYALNLKGTHAIYVRTSHSEGAIRLRLTGNERPDTVASRRSGEEVLWKWADMDRQHLVLSQPHHYTGYTPAHIDYVKLVPLPAEQVRQLRVLYDGQTDKLVAGYFEPYSWAFVEDLTSPLQHREPLTAFAEARIGITDIQVGRFGMKSVFETRATDQLLHATIGDPIGDVVQPKTDNVGKMQQYSNTLDAELLYARELGLVAHANFGASNCYPGTPLQGDFSKEHPDWMRGSALRFEVPEVRAYALSLYRETLEIGARGISIDFCRYPETIDTAETCTTFLRELRALANEFNPTDAPRIAILVRFPGTGVRRAELFDYAAWIREDLVDYLCPSNIQGRHMNIDMTPYFDAVKGSRCTLLPEVDALEWGLPFPGPFLWRVAELYKQGAVGLYIYQADGRVLGKPEDRRAMRLLADSRALQQWWAGEEAARPARSKGIYISAPHEFGIYHGWERIRIWTEGVPMGELEVYLDDALVNHCDGPPYLVGTEDDKSDGVIPAGEHQLKIRAKDGDAWLEQIFTVKGA